MTNFMTADLIGKAAYHRSGAYLGRVADLVMAPDPDGAWRLTHLVVSHPPWGRLLGYDFLHPLGSPRVPARGS